VICNTKTQIRVYNLELGFAI